VTDVSVVIVTHNSAGYVGACLDALGPACEGVTTEVLVIDTASGDETLTRLERRPGLEILALGANEGFARANNRGIRRARGATVVLLNPDTVARPGSLAELHRFLTAAPRRGAAGPRLVTGEGKLQPSAGGLPTLLTTFAHAAGLNRHLPSDEASRARLHAMLSLVMPRSSGRLGDHLAEPRRCEVVWAAAVALRAAALEEVGPLDEGLFMYGEENDLCARLGRAGWEVWFDPRAEIVHFGGGSGAFAPPLAAQYYRSRRRFFRRHGGVARRLAAPLAILGGLLMRPLVALFAGRGAAAMRREARFSLATAAGLAAAGRRRPGP